MHFNRQFFSWRRFQNLTCYSIIDTAIHDLLLKKAGPDWYQELSPQQLRTVDNLERCINLDVRNNTDLYSKDNIASLGLVLRPNSAHIQVALKFCCNCPVEFLLILYQVINPKRKR